MIKSCRIICIISLSLFFNLSVFSQIISLQQAQFAAYNFLHEMNSSVKTIEDLQHSFTSETSLNEPAWYVFTTGNRGYLIISAELSAYPVLAYSYDSPFFNNPSNFPPSFAFWMDQRTQEIEEIRTIKHAADNKTTEIWDQLLNGSFSGNHLKSRSMEPLLKSAWNQDCRYNEMCPEDPSGPCGRVYAGCVATAMSQIMYYWRFPETGIGSTSYNASPYGTQYVNYASATYLWDEMKGSINTSHPELAKLLYHAGVAVRMNYSPSGSGASSTDVPNALKYRFRYASASYRSKSNYTTTNWNNLLIGNLDNKYPIYYSGSGNGSGHAFNLDGYQGTDHFHFDWGWSGAYNGYYYLSNLNPGSSSFNSWQAAVVDIYPPGASYPQNCNGMKTLTAVSGSIEDGSGPIDNYEPNVNCSWLIKPTHPVDWIRLNFVDMDTESGNDVITIYNGETTSANVIGTYSGSTLPPTIQGTGQSMLVTFSSNGSQEHNGFLIEYSANPTSFCSGTAYITDYSGTIHDGSGSGYQYNNNANCRWIIEPAYASSIHITFTEFDTEPVYDKIRISDLENSILLIEHSGSDLPAPLVINASKVLIHFITNSSVQSSGWTLQYSTVTDVEEQTHTQVRVYPNPASDIVYIDLPEQKQIGTISVLDMSGKSCLTKDLNDAESSIQLDISSLPSGMYLLQIETGDISYHSKLSIF